MNYPLVTAFVAIIFTQIIKYPIALLTKGKKASVNIITATGGMPSSHSAAVSSLITALALEYGVNSPYVAIATVFGVIIMFDSKGVRRQSGEQGLVLDAVVRQHDQLDLPEHLPPYQDLIIKKYLGHKPTEVIVGMFTGFVIALVCDRLFDTFGL